MSHDKRKECLNLAIDCTENADEIIPLAQKFYDFLYPETISGVEEITPKRDVQIKQGEENLQTGKAIKNDPLPEPDYNPPAAGTCPVKKLTGRQGECLETAIALDRNHVDLTVNAVYEALEDISSAGAAYLLRELEDKGFMASAKKGRQLCYIPLHYLDGTPYVRNDANRGQGTE